MNKTGTVSSSTGSATQTEESLLAQQQQAYQEQQKIETESAIMQSKHDSMMAVIRAIAS